MKKRKTYNTGELKKKLCEICGIKDKSVLEIHHIIPRQDPRCTNDHGNLAVLCGNCHTLVHRGYITIIGVYGTTDGRELMFFKRGEKPPLEEQFWKVKHNPFIRTL